MATRCFGLLVAVCLALVTAASASSVSTALWKEFERLIPKNATADEVAVRFLRRFSCFEECDHLSECLAKDSEAFSRDRNWNETLFVQVATLLLDRVLSYGAECHPTRPVCKEHSLCAVEHLPKDPSKPNDGTPVNEPSSLDALLLILKQKYRPSDHKCFSSDAIYGDVGGKEQDGMQYKVNIMLAIFLRLYKGECIVLKHSIDFISEILSRFPDDGNNSLSEESLYSLMKEIGIVRDDHDHDHEDEHSHENHRHSHEADEHESSKAGATPRAKRHADEHDHDDHNLPVANLFNVTDDCWGSKRLLYFFDDDGSGNIDKEEFLKLCPALVQQRLQGTCLKIKEDSPRSMAEVYGYGTLAVFLISLCSVLGVILLPLQKSSVYQYLMMCFIALAFGTLTGDALLHLIPESVGLHSHEDGASGEHVHDENGLPPSFWKFFVILSAIYGLFVFEGLADLAVRGVHNQENDKAGGHGHSHIPSIDLVQMTKDVKTISSETLESTVSGPPTLNGNVPSAEHHTTQKLAPMCCGMTTLALVIIIGDAIHNVADGLTIGAAFSSSTKGGISSALAIFFHELPHEFGDFVILLSTGFSFKKALIWNFVASLTAFIGLFVGIEVGENEEARQWILTVAAGMFLYIALGDMLPELKNQKGKNGVISFIVQNVGALVGMTFMILMSVFEDQIKV